MNKELQKQGNIFLETYTKGIIYDTNKTKVFEWYIGADFYGGSDRDNAQSIENVLSISGYVITYDGCPMLWASKRYKEISLSTAEPDYINLYNAL